MKAKDDVTVFHKVLKSIRKILPKSIVEILRSFFTAFYSPIYFSYLNGHFKSSLKRRAVDRHGEPLPWYTYPAIDFLRTRDFSNKIIVEFGGGQSTLWWAARAKQVITFEDDQAWLEQLQSKIPSNVKLYLVSNSSEETCTLQVQEALNTFQNSKVDILVVDGLFRIQMADIACQVVSPTGAIICDNAEGYGFYEFFLKKDFQRVDFYGHTAGVMIPHATSICFKDNCFLFEKEHPIPIQE